MGRTSKLLIFLLLIATFTTVNNLAFNFAAAQNAFLQSKNDGAVNKDIASNKDIPSAESVYSSQSMTLPKSVGYFIWYIADEAHENSNTAMHKHVSDHNPNYLPTNLTSPQGVALSFLDADAPWDHPHPHTINIVDSNRNIVYTTGRMDYTNSSEPITLPPGKYSVIDTKYTWMKGSISITHDNSDGKLVVGGFYTPTNVVENNKDNDGGSHPGWLGYYKTEFPKNGFKILSQYNFHYATCKNCPGGYWQDQKTADHTLVIYSVDNKQLPLSDVFARLAKMVWNNVYI